MARKKAEEDDDVYLDKFQTRGGVKKSILYM
jgi:hypothetical protein